MENQDLKKMKLEAHTQAIESHKALLEKLHLDTNIRLDEINKSFETLTMTLEEYLKVIGIG